MPFNPADDDLITLLVSKNEDPDSEHPHVIEIDDTIYNTFPNHLRGIHDWEDEDNMFFSTHPHHNNNATVRNVVNELRSWNQIGDARIFRGPGNSSQPLAAKKVFLFHVPGGRLMPWVLYEYSLVAPPEHQAWVLNRVVCKRDKLHYNTWMKGISADSVIH